MRYVEKVRQVKCDKWHLRDNLICAVTKWKINGQVCIAFLSPNTNLKNSDYNPVLDTAKQAAHLLSPMVQNSS